MRLRALLALVVTAASVVCGTPLAQAAPDRNSQSVQPQRGTIALVPVDNRQFTVQIPSGIANAGGYQVLTPPAQLLGHYFEPADRGAVADWLLRVAPQADAIIVNVPLLAYGGLIQQRYGTVSLEDARRVVDVLRTVRQRNPRKPIYVSDVIMRLATSPYDAYPGNYANKIRRWAILTDQVKNLGQEEFRAEYEQLSAEIPRELLDDYLAARARNHAINKLMVDLTAEGTIDYLALGQDDAFPYGPHRLERETLQAYVTEKAVADRTIIAESNADVAASLLTARLINQRAGVVPRISVDYSRLDGKDWIRTFASIPYAEEIEAFVSELGGRLVGPGEPADIRLFANTGGSGSLEPFADRILTSVARNEYVAIGDDVIPGVVDSVLMSALQRRLRISELEGFSGWSVGMSLAQASTRWNIVEASRAGNLLPADTGVRRDLLVRSAQAHAQVLLQEIVHTFGFRTMVRDQSTAYAESLGADPQRIDADKFDAVDNYVRGHVQPIADDLARREFAGRPIRIGSPSAGAVEYATVDAVTDWSIYLPWNRTAELVSFPKITLRTDWRPADSLARVAVVPRQQAGQPGEVLPFEVVVANRSSTPLSGQLRARFPAGWTVSGPASSVELTAGGSQTVRFTATSPAETALTTYPASVAYDFSDGNGTTGTASADTEVQLRLRNVAAASEGATATASSVFSSYVPDRAIDSDTVSSTSRWVSGVAATNWLQVDFAGPATVNTVKVFHQAGWALIDFDIEVRTDAGWRPVASVRANTSTRTTHVFAPITADAVRLVVTKTPDSRARVLELEAYHDPSV